MVSHPSYTPCDRHFGNGNDKLSDYRVYNQAAGNVLRGPGRQEDSVVIYLKEYNNYIKIFCKRRVLITNTKKVVMVTISFFFNNK
jgi:hypothetical protein